MFHDRHRAAQITRVVIALVVWFALALQQYLIISRVPANGLTTLSAIGRFLIFFTILTNLLAAFCVTALLLSPRSRIGQFFARPSTATAIAADIFIVFLVYNLILRWIWAPTGPDRLADELLHVVVPVLYIVYWILFVPKGTLKWSNSWTWCLYPALYLVYALVRGKLEGFYPYPFLDIKVLGLQRVLFNSAGLIVLFMVTFFLIIWLDRIMRPTSLVKA